MKEFKLLDTGAPPEVSTLLFAAWVQYFSEERFGFQQRGGGLKPDGAAAFNFGSPAEDNFTLERSPQGNWTLQSTQGIAAKDIEAIVKVAKQKHDASDFGGDVMYQTTMQAPAFDNIFTMMSHFMRMLGDQVPIAGQRRLGYRVLLEFTPALPADSTAPPLFVPATDIKVSIFAPGPTASNLTDRAAEGMIEIIGAICALALGRVVEVPLAIFPANAQEAAAAQALRYDTTIDNLARHHTSLDIFDEFLMLGGPDGVFRVRGALLSYHAALQQASPDVALMLLVTSLEALVVPRPEWRKDKATKRFIEAIRELCPEVVDGVVNHANVEQAFMYKRRGGKVARRRQLLDRVYELRSNPTHSGLGLSGVGVLSMLAEPGSIRVALLSDLARGALLNFLQAPRSSLVGHPIIDPVAAR